MQLIEAFVHNPVKVAVGVLLFVLFGLIGLARMPMQLTPEVQIPTVTVSTHWRGAAPQEIEREIVLEQEEQLKAVQGVTKMSSQCSHSQGQITLEFAVGTDIDTALRRVNIRLQQVPEYPEEADEPVISTSDPNANAIGWFILRPRVASSEEIAEFQASHPELKEALEPARRAHNSGLRSRRLLQLVEERPEIEASIQELLPKDIYVPGLQRFAEDRIKAAFERVEGVSKSNVYGGREDEMQVIVDPQKLAARGLTITDVRDALTDQNRDSTAGDVWDGKRRYLVRVTGQFQSPQDVADVIIKQTDDGPVHVRDVAKVQLGLKKPTGLVKNFGTLCIAVNCIRETGANVLDTMEDLYEVRDRLNRELLAPQGLELIQVYDETDYIHSAIDLVVWNIIIGSVLTVAILLLFLRSGRSTLVIGLAIPTSIIGTFLMLHLMGRSLNVISLAGLAFAVGMLVDNAVVVLENVFRHYQGGEKPFVASVRGAQEVWGAVVASTLTTLAVFLPVLFVEEEAGQLFRDIALAISSAVALSLVVSITVIPTAAARILKRRKEEERPPEPFPDALEPSGNSLWKPSPGPAPGGLFARLDAAGAAFVRAVVELNRAIQKSLAVRLVTVVGFVGAAAMLTWALWPKIEYLPSGNRNLVFGQLLPPSGYNIDKLMDLGVQLENGAQPYWDIDKGDPANEELQYPAIDDYFFVASRRGVFFGLRAVDPLRAGELVPLVNRLGSQLPGTYGFARQASLWGRGVESGRQIDVEITGPEPERLVGIGKQIMAQVRGIVPNSSATPRPSLDLNSPEMHLRPKWNRMAEMGLSKRDFDYTVDALTDGAYAGDYYEGGDKIDLTIIASEKSVEHTGDLRQLPFPPPSGGLVTVADAADDVLTGGPEQIYRREQQRAITIQVRPSLETPLEEALENIDQKIVQPMRKAGEIGGEYEIRLAGTADKLRATGNALKWNFLLALLITYLLMAALFESWLYPLVIILSVPLGAIGGLAGLALLNVYLPLQKALGLSSGGFQTLDVLTMLGFVILIGTVVNNAILIVHQSLNHMRYEEMEPNRAILESVRNRIRPIFMTTATTVLGLSPLVLFPGAGSEIYRGLGAIVLGGLVVSTVFTLVLVPTLFSLMMDAKAALRRRLGWDAKPPETGEAAEPKEAVAAS